MSRYDYHSMRTLAGILASTLAVATAQLRPIASTVIEHSLKAKSDHGETVLAARTMLVDISLPSGGTRQEVLWIIFHSATGYFDWGLGGVGSNQLIPSRKASGPGPVYVAAASLLHFAANRSHVGIFESATKAGSLDEAESKALADAINRVGPNGQRNANPRMIPIGKLLPIEFCCPPGNAFCPEPTILEVLRRGNTWELVLQGQWQEKITLNDKFELSGHARVD